MGRKTSIAEMSILLSADPSGVKSGVAEAKKEVDKFFPRVKTGDMDFARVGAGIDKKFQRASITGKSPFMLSKRAALDETLEDLGKSLKVERAKQKFGSLGATAAKFGNQMSEAAEVAALAAPPLAAAGALFAVSAVMIGTIFELAKAADPQKAKEWDQAWKDLYVVLGQAMVPVLVSATENLRAFVNILNMIPKNAMPSVGQGAGGMLGGIFGQSGGAIGKSIGGLLEKGWQWLGGKAAEIGGDTTGIGGMDAPKATLGSMEQWSDALTMAAAESGQSPQVQMVEEQKKTNELLTSWVDRATSAIGRMLGLRGG